MGEVFNLYINLDCWSVELKGCFYGLYWIMRDSE